jgi:hypothetical protein
VVRQSSVSPQATTALASSGALDELSGDETRRGVLDALGRASSALADLVKLDESQQETLSPLSDSDGVDGFVPSRPVLVRSRAALRYNRGVRR